MTRPRLLRALAALLAFFAVPAQYAVADPWAPVNPLFYVQVDQDRDFQQYLKNLADTDPDRIKTSIAYDHDSGAFTVTLWDGAPISVTQADLRTVGAHKGGKGATPLWPVVLKIAEAKRRAAGLSGKPLTG